MSEFVGDSGPPRGPAKARLSRERIITAGLELASAPGRSVISVRELGAHLGSDPTAIYRHFRSKDHLMQELLDAVFIRSIAGVSADSDQWRQRLRQLAARTLEQFEKYPVIGADAVTVTTQGPGELDAIEFMLDAFSVAGLCDDEVVRHYGLFAFHVLGSAAGIARARTQEIRGPEGTERWLEGPLLTNPQQHPHIIRLSKQLSNLEERVLFDLGVEAVIQSAERIVANQ
ncbi:TetR/AcrR family transcriptional regulator [Homoserinimonas sp. OAct 916]|uniref:TetR/AcrR family transcriptional regulator n=1 Tax=Homoserinimonas sp. OAct 916 TaxID=2211450 RepID=UPI000DBE1B2A|nr:TetR/AcrR family transcriptional regulator [Homoserinimonas sp. OAct 916]